MEKLLNILSAINKRYIGIKEEFHRLLEPGNGRIAHVGIKNTVGFSEGKFDFVLRVYLKNQKDYVNVRLSYLDLKSPKDVVRAAIYHPYLYRDYGTEGVFFERPIKTLIELIKAINN